MQRRHEVDALIVGGGPAGCAAAIALAKRGARVALVDRGSRNDERVGETLPPSAIGLLRELGLWDLFREDNHRPSFGVRTAWGSSSLDTNDYLYYPYGVGWHLDRSRFDQMMIAAAQSAGVCLLRPGRPTLIQPMPGGWLVDLDVAASRRCVAASVLIDATGRAACVARRAGARQVTFDRLIAVARFYAHRGEDIGEAFTLVEATRTGWWYTAFLPSNRLVAISFSDPDFVRHLEPPRHTAARLRRGTPVSKALVSAAYTARLDRIAGDGWLAVGDAASTWDPLSSQGIAKALSSGLAAASAVMEYLRPVPTALQQYADLESYRFGRYLAIHRKHYRLEMRWSDAPFWKRRHAGLADSGQPELQN